jgi:3-isopropylmalate/(R)-2-methylmalate dehydratase small subunit
MSSTGFRGRVWVFGDHVNTDVIMPGTYVLAGNLQGREPHEWCFEAIRPGWAAQVRPGDILVGGRNFGCGSGRNPAPLLRKLGVQAVLVESAARGFFRNSINSGLPVITCRGVHAVFADGDVMHAEMSTGRVVNDSTGAVLHAEPIPEDSPPAQILAAGGFENFVAELLTSGRVPGEEPR